MNDITSEKIKLLDELFRKSRHVVIISHNGPDGDAVGSTSAMLSYLSECRGVEDVRIILPNKYGAFLDFIPGERLLASENPESARHHIDNADLIVVLDMNKLLRADALGEMVRDRNVTKVLIDHHPAPETSEFDLVFSKQDISSASEYLYGILLMMPEISGDASRLPADCRLSLMTGMTTDTNNFANSVYPSTLQMASDLLAAGVDRDEIILHLYQEYRENRVRAMGYLTHEKLIIREDGFAYIIIDRETLDRFSLEEGETEGLVNVPLSLGKVKVSALLKEDDGYFRVSLRSKKGICVNLFAGEFFHGGGHAQASGGRIFIPNDIHSANEVEAYLNRAADKFMNGK